MCLSYIRHDPICSKAVDGDYDTQLSLELGKVLNRRVPCTFDDLCQDHQQHPYVRCRIGESDLAVRINPVAKRVEREGATL